MLYDRAQIKGSARITRDGYLVADALVARANNVQEYRAAELGLTDRDPTATVRIFRPETEVFAKDALASLAHRPITIRHPAESVTAENWRKLGIGDVGGDVMRDGEFIRVPIKIMDSAAVESVATDHQEFSLGYSITLDMTPGEHAGQVYDGVAREFRYNHLAAVPVARGGTALRIIDERPAKEKSVATIMLDGLKVDLSDAEAVQAAFAKLSDRARDAETALADAQKAHDKAIGAKDAEIADLKAKVVDQAQIDALADAKADVVAKAKAVVGDKLPETAGKSVADVRRMTVAAAVGDEAVADKSDDYVEARFDALTANVKAKDSKVVPIHTPANVNDADKEVADAYAEMVADLTGTKKTA